jgi:hypothetical protein
MVGLERLSSIVNLIMMGCERLSNIVILNMMEMFI